MSHRSKNAEDYDGMNCVCSVHMQWVSVGFCFDTAQLSVTAAVEEALLALSVGDMQYWTGRWLVRSRKWNIWVDCKGSRLASMQIIQGFIPVTQEVHTFHDCIAPSIAFLRGEIISMTYHQHSGSVSAYAKGIRALNLETKWMTILALNFFIITEETIKVFLRISTSFCHPEAWSIILKCLKII